MKTVDEVRNLILASLEPSLRAQGLAANAVSDETDLRAAGLIDSFGFVRLLGHLEQYLGRPIDLAALDPAQLTKVGALARHIAAAQ